MDKLDLASLQNILMNLPAKDILSVSKVCRRLRDVICDESKYQEYGSLWQKLFERDFPVYMEKERKKQDTWKMRYREIFVDKVLSSKVFMQLLSYLTEKVDSQVEYKIVRPHGGFLNQQIYFEFKTELQKKDIPANFINQLKHIFSSALFNEELNHVRLFAMVLLPSGKFFNLSLNEFMTKLDVRGSRLALLTYMT